MGARCVEQLIGSKDMIRAMAHLPGLQVEIVHQRLSDEVEQISIELQAEPSFDAFGQFLFAERLRE